MSNTIFEKKTLDNGMVRSTVQPHTKDIEALPTAASGPLTGDYYFAAKHFGEDAEFEAMLTEIAKLQDTDENSWTFGCLRWYREEPCIRDTNGAFFTLRYIACALCAYPERISSRECEIIMPVLERAAVWFEKECFGHGYFYPNKIMSDGGLLMLIGMVTSNNDTIEKARKFWEGWLSYTKDYGWGWGENTSKCYLPIMVDALNLALICLDNSDSLYQELLAMRNRLLDYKEFHGDYEFVPSIRTYNFDGNTCSQGSTSIANDTRLILEKIAPEYIPAKSKETFHTEKIFEKSYATTYKGENIRLGTINKFPVMPTCYQTETWGLGWQSMPVSVLAKDHETSFLRFSAISGGNSHTHPAEDKHSAYLFNRLFEDENIPDCFTISKQDANTAVVVRGMYHIANKASYLADEWYLQHFDWEFCEYNDWFVLNYKDCVLAIKPLGGSAKVTRNGEKIRISQVAYDGEEKLIIKRKWITSWAVAVLDTAENYEAELDKIATSYEVISDLRYSRIIPPIKITCGKAELTFDPDFDV